jgi:hypothetical protein
LQEWQRAIREDKAKFPGSLEYRWNRKPLLYTMWLRDWGAPDSIGHLGIHFYQGQHAWPNLRVSMLDGSKMLSNMHDEFETAWRDATPPEDIE